MTHEHPFADPGGKPPSDAPAFTAADVVRLTAGRQVRGLSLSRCVGVTTDSRALKAGELFVALRGDRFDGHDYLADVAGRGAAGVVIERNADGSPRPLPAGWDGFAVEVADALRALGALAAEHRRRMPARVVGVTGSNGKTTTKEMIHHLLSAGGEGESVRSAKSFNNFVGVPLTLLTIRPAHKFAVVEIGTNHPGEVARLADLVRPEAAVVVSVHPSHLEGLGSVEGVCEEEADGLLGLSPGGVAVVHVESPGLVEAARRRVPAGAVLLRFGRAAECELRLVDVEARWDGGTVTVEVSGRLAERLAPGAPRRFGFHLPVPGPHNAQNAAAATAVALWMGVRPEVISGRWADFRLPEMRLQIDPAGPVTLVADCYNANPGSMAAAVEVLKLAPVGRRKVFCAGDMLELGTGAAGYHRDLGACAARAGVELLVAVGAFAPEVATGATDAGLPASRVTTFADSTLAAAAVGAWLRPTDFVLVKGSRGIRMERVAEAVGRTGRAMTGPASTAAA